MAPKNDRRAAVELARRTWDGAPLHMRTLAGAYVGPLLAAVEAIGKDLDRLDRLEAALCNAAGVLRLEELKGAKHGA